MRKSIFLLILGLAIFSVMVMATPTATITTTNGYLKGATNTVTCAITPTNNFGVDTNITSVSFWYRNTSAGAWAVFNRSTQFNLTSYSAVLVSTKYTDSTTFGLNCTIAINGTGATQLNLSSAVITKTLDNTAPRVVATLDFDVAKDFQQLDCKTASSDATSGLSNYSTILTLPDTTTVTNAPSDGIVQYTSDNLIIPSDSTGYTANCTVYDIAGNSASATSTFGVTSKDGTTRKAQAVVTTTKQNNKIKVGLGILAFVFLMGVVVILTGKKAKKRRR